MKEIIEKITASIKEHEESLEEQRDQFVRILGVEYDGEPIAELISDCDWDNDDFSIGWEQGYLSGMKSVLRHLKSLNEDALESLSEISE